jgi:ribosomal protein S18 acetylase RimI-like enzyme
MDCQRLPEFQNTASLSCIFDLVEHVLTSRIADLETRMRNRANAENGVRRLCHSDLDGALRLTRAAGWNQLAADWERLLFLEPEGCFALECDGQVAASTTVLCYGKDLAWVGMVLTAPEFRRRGFAESLIVHALEFAESRKIANLKLDATDSGIELYRKYGFVDECEIERWHRNPGPVEPTEVSGYSPDHAYDQINFGADRTHLLRELAKSGAASIFREGYAMGRPGFSAAYFGPCVAKSGAVARRLLRWFLADHSNDPVFWDLFPANKEAVRIAGEFGFSPVRRLTRMVLSRAGAHRISNSPEVFAIAGFELG